jgi:hypothetical protein
MVIFKQVSPRQPTLKALKEGILKEAAIRRVQRRMTAFFNVTAVKTSNLTRDNSSQ